MSNNRELLDSSIIRKIRWILTLETSEVSRRDRGMAPQAASKSKVQGRSIKKTTFKDKNGTEYHFYTTEKQTEKQQG